MKTCPSCAEQIQEAAVLCRYCRTWLDGRDGVGGRLARLLVAVGILGLVASLAVPILRPGPAAALAVPAAVADSTPPGLGPLGARETKCPTAADGTQADGRRLPPGHPPIDGMMDWALRLPLRQMPLGSGSGNDWPAGAREL